MSPYYILKLAQDSGSTKVVQNWLSSNQWHPNQHHFTYVIEWNRKAGVSVPPEQYVEACAAHSTSLPQQQQQQQEGLDQDYDQDLTQPPQQQQQEEQQQAQLQQQQPGEDTDMQQQQQPDHNHHNQQQQQPCWVPDGSVNLRSGAAYEVVGCYVFTALEAPQQHESVVPIHALRRDPHAKVVSLEDCVEAFLQPEQLSEADEWYCPKCKTHVQVGAGCYLWEGLWWCV
jgi:ubiquitin C-terminal hydrolase